MASQPDPQQADTQTLAGLSAALGAGAAVAVPTVLGILAGAGVTAAAGKAALSLLTARPTPVRGGLVAPAAAATDSSEVAYRAAYLLNAARRIQAGLDRGLSLRDAIAAEAPNYRAHRAAAANRAATAAKVDMAAREHGPVLGWYARMDDRTSAECRAANGKNFPVTTRPLIGWPGSVHPNCRCRPGPAHAGAGWVDDQATASERQAAVA